MKSVFTVLALAVLMFSQDALSQHRRPGGDRPGRGGWDHPRRPDRPRYPRGPRYPRHRDTTVVTCAPAVVANNLQTADSVLAGLANAELKSNATFTAKVSEVAAIESAQDKSAAYLALAGVDANNAEEVLNFIYAREASASNVLAAQKNLDLNADQATLVINKLTTALKPLN